MAPSPAGGDQSGQGNSDACDARQQLDPPSKRRRLEELGESYRHKRQKIQEQQNDMPTLGYSTNHDYRGPGDEPEQPARLDAYSPQDSESGTDNTLLGGDKYRQSKAKSGIRPPSRPVSSNYTPWSIDARVDSRDEREQHSRWSNASSP
ncbi:hypothetical protein CDV31_017139 [Fusarium ambrosium]|uniref:Uncharacterized protein n=1 Tax=Fusarium ambrosium TaxID=131363 RepID=A0A428RRQ0_9HYPO|nr:hypothetical protein CDV31_017139 [Fusarium ambrosium]